MNKKWSCLRVTPIRTNRKENTDHHETEIKRTKVKDWKYMERETKKRTFHEKVM